MKQEALKERAEMIRRSSSFRAGDHDSFTVKFSEAVSLPGKHDPAEYLDRLGLTKVEGHIAVICPGNCGLMAELRRRGAERVIAFEPRNHFHRSMTSILQLLNESANVPHWPFSSNLWWPTGAATKITYDMVIWANGMEFMQLPVEQIEGVFSILKPGGTMFIEVTHGAQGVPERKVNSWRPTEEAFHTVVRQARPGADIMDVAPGRFDKRMVYMVTDEFIVLTDEEDSTVPSDESLATPEPEVLDEEELAAEALDYFPEDLQPRISLLLDAGFDYHVVKDKFDQSGETGIAELESAEPQA